MSSQDVKGARDSAAGTGQRSGMRASARARSMEARGPTRCESASPEHGHTVHTPDSQAEASLAAQAITKKEYKT